MVIGNKIINMMETNQSVDCILLLIFPVILTNLCHMIETHHLCWYYETSHQIIIVLVLHGWVNKRNNTKYIIVRYGLIEDDTTVL